jgi:hypothetical protein
VLEDGGFVGDFDEEGEAELGAAAAGVDGALFDGEGEEVFVADVEQGQDTAAQVGVGVIDGEEVLGDLEHGGRLCRRRWEMEDVRWGRGLHSLGGLDAEEVEA